MSKFLRQRRARLGFLGLSGLLAISTLNVSVSFAADPSCTTCTKSSGTAAVAPSASALGLNVSAVLRSSGFGSAPASALGIPTATAGPVANWDGTGDLPGAFQRPWELAANSNFDPSFRTSYWTPETGPIQVPWAPWNWPTTLMQMAPSMGLTMPAPQAPTVMI